MKVLGLTTSLRIFDLDLLFTASQLRASGDTELDTFAASALEQRGSIRDLRLKYEDIEDLETIIMARKTFADIARDTTLVRLGKFMDSLDTGLRQRIMDKSPSTTARLPQDKETQAIDDILRRIAALDAAHPVRISYEQTLAQENEAFKNISEEVGDLHDKYIDARTAIRQAKVDADSFRNSLYGQLVQKFETRGA